MYFRVYFLQILYDRSIVWTIIIIYHSWRRYRNRHVYRSFSLRISWIHFPCLKIIHLSNCAYRLIISRYLNFIIQRIASVLFSQQFMQYDLLIDAYNFIGRNIILLRVHTYTLNRLLLEDRSQRSWRACSSHIEYFPRHDVVTSRTIDYRD